MPGRVLGDVIAEGIAAIERLEGIAGLGEPSGVEVGLAAGVELVGRRLVRIGARLARETGHAARRAGRGDSGPARRRSAPRRAGRGNGREGSRKTS